MSNEINIQIINTCRLNCTWCGKHWVGDIEPRYMDNQTFYKVVDRCLDSGIDTFCLTPMHGEVFNDMWFDKKLMYLENNEQVKHYFFATNLMGTAMGFPERIQGLKKLRMEISLYGQDRESYLRHTNFDGFGDFVTKFASFVTKPKTYDVTIYVRFPQPIVGLVGTLLKVAEHNDMEVSYNETHNYNWGGLIPEGSLEAEHPMCVKNGVCPTARTGCIFENGDVGLCYMNDIKRENIFGNILTEPLSDILSSDKYKRVIEDMTKNVYHGICEKCNERF